MEGFLEEEGGWTQFCGCLGWESGLLGSIQTPHKGSGYIIFITLCP